MVYKGLMDFNSYMNSPGAATTKTTLDQPAFELAPAAFFSFYQGFYPEYYRLRSATLTKTAAKVEATLEQQQKVQIANEEAAEKRRQWLATPEGQKYQAEQAAASKQKADAERLSMSKEYPYYALVTCEFNNQNTNITSCFSTNIGTELELRNGNDYNMYKGVQLLMGEVGKVTPEGLVINLRSKFTLKMQNSSESLLLGVKVFDRMTGNILYQKKAGLYGVIYIRN